MRTISLFVRGTGPAVAVALGESRGLGHGLLVAPGDREGMARALSAALTAAWARRLLGDPLVAIGDPFGLDDTVTSGIVSALHRAISGLARIAGSFTQQEAADLSLKLRSGAQPADLTYLEERTVGPSLGRDSIRQGILASIIGFISS